MSSEKKEIERLKDAEKDEPYLSMGPLFDDDKWDGRLSTWDPQGPYLAKVMIILLIVLFILAIIFKLAGAY